MWWIRTNSTGEDRGGWQNRDVGRRTFDNDFGPDFGVDYARFSDPPDPGKDLRLKQDLERKLKENFPDPDRIHLKVKNGFVVLKGEVKNADLRSVLLETIYATPGVREIINEISVMDERMEGHKLRKDEGLRPGDNVAQT